NEQQANAHAAQADEQRDDAQRQRDAVRALNDQLQRTLYAAHMNLAQHAWDAGGVERVSELLEQYRPKPGETDLRGFEWHYLDRPCHAELLTMKGPATTVNAARSVSYSPDGKRLASLFFAGTVKVWDAQTGQELLTFQSDGRKVAFSPDGKR